MLLCIYASHGLLAQAVQDSLDVEKPQKSLKLSALPVVFYLPETKFGFGAAGIATYKHPNYKGIKPSQVQFATVYTLRKQLLIFAPFELYFKEDKLRWSGEIGYFKYFYNYFGQGIQSNREDVEVYNANFPKLASSVSYAITSKIYIGGQVHLENFKTFNIIPSSLVGAAFGSGGGFISTLGVDVLYDARDHIILPTKGFFLNVKTESSGHYTGGSYSYHKLELDARHFYSFVDNNTIGINFYLGLSTGSIPFNQQYYYSNAIKLRGFDDRRFQDNNMILLQSEYRFPIYKRFTGVAFWGIGSLSQTTRSLLSNRFVQTGGGGLRFLLNKRDKVNLRLDYAFTGEGSNFYLTVKEAF